MPPLIAHADAVKLVVYFFVSIFIYIHSWCMQAIKSLASLHIYTGSPGPSFLDSKVSTSTKIKCAGSLIESLCYSL